MGTSTHGTSPPVSTRCAASGSLQTLNSAAALELPCVSAPPMITNLAILFGAEFNSELQRSQQREAGEPAPLDEPFLEPRDTTKLDKKAAK